MLSFNSFGQTNEERAKGYNENRPIFAKVMSDFVTKFQPSYSAGMTYKTFIGKVASADELSRDGAVILKKAFTYLENGTAISTIQKNESGYEIAVAYLSYMKTKTTKPFEEQPFGKSNSTAKGF